MVRAAALAAALPCDVWERATSRLLLLPPNAQPPTVALKPIVSACPPCRVGNGLGAGSAAQAKLSALASAATVPPLWAALAVVLLVPRSQVAVISIFTSDTSDPVLMGHMQHLLSLLAVLLLCDMSQCGE